MSTKDVFVVMHMPEAGPETCRGICESLEAARALMDSDAPEDTGITAPSMSLATPLEWGGADGWSFIIATQQHEATSSTHPAPRLHAEQKGMRDIQVVRHKPIKRPGSEKSSPVTLRFSLDVTYTTGDPRKLKRLSRGVQRVVEAAICESRVFTDGRTRRSISAAMLNDTARGYHASLLLVDEDGGAKEIRTDFSAPRHG